MTDGMDPMICPADFDCKRYLHSIDGGFKQLNEVQMRNKTLKKLKHTHPSLILLYSKSESQLDS